MSQSGTDVREHSWRSTYECYPHLTKEEFAEVCHHFDNKYCQATLGPLRRQWRLRVYTTLDASFAQDGDYTTVVQITQPLRDNDGLNDLGLRLDGISLNHTNESVQYQREIEMEIEEADQECLSVPPAERNFGHVQYEIHLHPTYRMPCLWFTLHDLPADEQAFNIDTVFRRLVPDQYKDALRRTGPIGGISADHHPITGIPSFFVHPCFLGDAMAGFDCPKEDYLMVWLGLVGGCVGLWVPKAMAMTHRR